MVAQRARRPTRLAEAHGFLDGPAGGCLLPLRRRHGLHRDSPPAECAAWPDASPPPPAAGPAAGCAHADPLGRAGPAHPHLQRAPGGGRDPRRRSSRWCPSPGTRCSAATSAAAPRRRVRLLLRAGRPACASAAQRPFAPTPLDRRHASPGARPARPAAAGPGARWRPSLDTIVDLSRQVVGATLQADAQLPTGSSFGGLRGGYATLTDRRAGAARLLLRARRRGRPARCRSQRRAGRRARCGSAARRRRGEACASAPTSSGSPARSAGRQLQHRCGQGPPRRHRRELAVDRPAPRPAAARCERRRSARPAATLSAWPTRWRTRAPPTCASTPATRSTGCRGGRRPSSGRASSTGPCSSRSATPPATGAT